MAFSAIKEGVAIYKEVAGTASDVNEIVTNISNHLGSFFTNQEKAVQELIEKKKNPPKGMSIQALALENVIARKRIAQAEVDLRELLIYHSGPVLGSIWTEFVVERDRLRTIQEKADIFLKKRGSAKTQATKVYLRLESGFCHFHCNIRSHDHDWRSDVSNPYLVFN